MTAPSARTASPSDGLARMLLDCGAFRTGNFRLASGATSDVYVDVKKAWTDPGRLRQLGRALAARVGDAERLAGMELGAVPLVVATALETGLPYVVIRKAAKGHGTNQRYEGEIPAGARLLLIEDVTTTGGSSADSLSVLRGAGARVSRVLCVIDREAGARALLAGLGAELESLATLRELRDAT